MSLFISLEGGEGSGKTSQINKLASALTAQGHKVLTTREPGGTEEGEKIRGLLVQRDSGNWNPAAETLMLFAARSMHIERVIKPALAREEIVITDRFTDSTIAYQGYGRGFALDKIKALQKLAIDDFAPDLTFILDIDVKTGLARSHKRLAGEKGFQNTEDRFERMDEAFHEKLRAGFLAIAKAEPKRCRVINAGQSLENITEEIRRHTLEKLAEKK